MNEEGNVEKRVEVALPFELAMLMHKLAPAIRQIVRETCECKKNVGDS